MKFSTVPTYLLLRLVGVSLPNVEGEEFAEVRIRYIALALVTIMVALLAGNSMGFAVYTLTESIRAYFVAAGLWFLVILTIESFLIVSLKPVLTFASVFAIIMRFAMAVLISQLVSVPLEQRIFKPEIVYEMSSTTSREVSADIDYFKKEYETELQGLETQRGELQNQIDALRSDCDQKYEDYIREWKGDKAEGLSGIPGEGRWTALNKLQYDRCRTALDGETNANNQDSKAAHLKTIVAHIAEVKKARDERVGVRKQAIEANTGLLARIEALRRLMDRSPEVKFKVWILRLFIILLETLPLTGKLFMLFAPVELFRQTREHLLLQYKGKKLRAEAESKRQAEVTHLTKDLKRHEFDRLYVLGAYSRAQHSSEFEAALLRHSRDIVGGLNVQPERETASHNGNGTKPR